MSFPRRITLWRLLARSPGPLTLRELAGRLGVSKNTVQRDLDALSSAGVPVREERSGQALAFSLPRSGDGAAEAP